MRIRLLSDLHQEVSAWTPPPVKCDVVILAGDVHYADMAVGWAREAFADVPVILTAGNHEHYETGSVRENIARMRSKAAGTNVHFLENESTVIDGVRFLGACMWTDFKIAGDQQRGLMLARQHMNDFHLCRWIADDGTERRFEPEDSLAMHRESKAWLCAELAKPFDGKTVVVTHHLPTPKSIHKRFHGDPMNAAFASDLEHLMDGVSVWAHGHTHAAVRVKVGECHVLCNPRGYSDLPECSDSPLSPDFVFELTDAGVTVPELVSAAGR